MIYLDYHASTPLAHEAIVAMRPFLENDSYANPHSTDHAPGRASAAAVELARQDIARVIGARPSEILFTSGATEANNTALIGAMTNAGPGHIVISALEHACVMAPAQALTQHQHTLTVLPVSGDGLLSTDDVVRALRPDTRLVSIQWVNNEIGTIQPIAAIAALCRERGVLLHCDAAQALGRLAIDVKSCPIDLLSLSAHKAYGPKGIGALFVKRGVKLSPVIHGGGQERLIRSGTLSPMLCAGFAAAAKLAAERFDDDQQRAGDLCAGLLHRLRDAGVNFAVNGSELVRVRDNLNLHFPGISTAQLLSSTPKLAISAASACSGGQQGGSHVLRAIGRTPSEMAADIRLAVGRTTTADDMIKAAEMLIAALR